MGVWKGTHLPADRRRDYARIAIYGGGAITAAGLAAVGVLAGQAEAARRVIPIATAPPPKADGMYGSKYSGEQLVLTMLGDSSAAGFGVLRARQTPGALIATGVSRRLERPVRLRNLAVVGSNTARMLAQVEVALEMQPDVAVVLVGANDLTHWDLRAASVRHLADAVRRLRSAGIRVVVGTCPDLGAVQPIRAPLRWVARSWSRRMAAAQTVAVVEAGGWTVSLGDLLGPAFSTQPHRMFAYDRYHPSAEGYALAASVLLPTVIAALREPERAADAVEVRSPAAGEVRSLPQAAVEAARHAGTEVHGINVAGRDRGPAGRWAQLRRRVFAAIRPADAEDPAQVPS